MSYKICVISHWSTYLYGAAGEHGPDTLFQGFRILCTDVIGRSWPI